MFLQRRRQQHGGVVVMAWLFKSMSWGLVVRSGFCAGGLGWHCAGMLTSWRVLTAWLMVMMIKVCLLRACQGTHTYVWSARAAASHQRQGPQDVCVVVCVC